MPVHQKPVFDKFDDWSGRLFFHSQSVSLYPFLRVITPLPLALARVLRCEILGISLEMSATLERGARDIVTTSNA